VHLGDINKELIRLHRVELYRHRNNIDKTPRVQRGKSYGCCIVISHFIITIHVTVTAAATETIFILVKFN
jgi:hypothetical protein